MIAAAVFAAGALPAVADGAKSSLYRGPGPRPGPDLLYSKAFKTPQLGNSGPWHAKPILVSGATSYRKGEFVYQDFLYDDHGARQQVDPGDPRTAGNLFSKPNGTYTYPTDGRYANNAADLVELRVKPLRRATAFRVTLNTLKDPSLVAFSIAIGGRAGHAFAFPNGANVRAPARLFLTVHARKGSSKLVAELRRASTGKLVKGLAPAVKLLKARRQIQVKVPHKDWNPRRGTVRLAAGVGLWDRDAGSYLLPAAAASESTPGGAGGASDPAAFFNVAFRLHEPFQKPTEGLAVVTNAAWWRDRDQGTALAANDISPFFAKVNFGKLRRHLRDDTRVPKRGPINRILATHFELSQGADFSQACLTAAADCPGQYQGRLQPYAIYVPHKTRPARGYGLTLLLHSLSASYNQYSSSRNQRQLGERGGGSIVITTESRGPDEGYENYGAADVFDVWADVARRYRLDPSWAAISGYSMGAIGTFKLGAQFPDLFARAESTVGDESNNDVLASLRNLPVLMWNNHGDELVNEAQFDQTAMALDSLGYRYEIDRYQPCANPACSPLFTNHLQLAINDQYAPAAKFLGTARVPRNPDHVTYVVDATRNHAKLRLVGNHAYWVSKLKRRDPSTEEGQIDALSRGFGGGVSANPTKLGTGSLTGGNLGTLTYDFQRKAWSPALGPLPADAVVVNATNISSAAIDVRRANVTCKAQFSITSDGPIEIALPGCNRTVSGT